MSSTYSAVFVALVLAAALLIGGYGLRVSRTTSDFFVASRTVSPWWNASAIGGEYLSAASFLGVAGLIFAYGPDMLWYPIGYTVGYLVLLALVAAPLRRSGAYTVPDFAEARLESRRVRRMASVLSVGIGWLYLVPQLQGAGLTLTTVTGAPGWLGALLVAVVVAVNVMAGGMRSITFVQAVQYWLKLSALAIPVIFLVLAWRDAGAPSLDGSVPAVFANDTKVTVQTTVDVEVSSRVSVVVNGVVDGRTYAGTSVSLTPGPHRIAAGAALDFPAKSVVPQVKGIPADTNALWAQPLGGEGHGNPFYVTYSLIIATFLGTMGLPHVVVRFYTNPNGRQARRTTVVVLALLGIFYVLPPAYAALGRIYTPELLLTGQTDAVVLVLPSRLVGGTLGELLGALVAGGAFAAFLSTSSGLTLSVAGVLSQDVLLLRGLRGFRVAAFFAAIVPFGAALLVSGMSLADVVGLAFAVAASSFCPLLLLGIWWRRLTPFGAMAGMIAGGGLALVAGLVTLLVPPGAGLVYDLLSRPAAWSVPLGFAVMIVGSLLTPRTVPASVNRTMVRLHAPEALGLAQEETP